jgi:DNA-binding CsgD family transcriptional regulator
MGSIKINFTINLVNAVPEGIEAFGFAMRFNDPLTVEHLLNHLPLLCNFTKIFKNQSEKFLRLLADNQVDLSIQFGQRFYERPKSFVLPFERDKFLCKIGFAKFYSLTPREKDILKFICNGYPTSYIANELHLSRKTVENYLSTIKCKLSCSSKTELIQKTDVVSSMGFFD